METHTQHFEEVNPAFIIASKTNPRTVFEPEDEAELLKSIADSGIHTPLLVRPDGDGYIVVDGERRLRAALKLKLGAVPCMIQELTDEQAIRTQLISHLQRKNIHPMEEAIVFGRLFTTNILTIGTIANLTGKPAHFIAQRLKLLDLCSEAKDIYAKGTITLEHATALAKMTSEDQKRALQWLIRSEYVPSREGEQRVRVAKDFKLFKGWIRTEISLNLSEAPFDKTDEKLIPGVAPCILCPKNSGYNTALFPELGAKHICGDRACFKAKVAAHLDREKKRVRKEEHKQFIMISTESRMDMDNPLKVDGVKMIDRFKIIKKGNECADTKVAQWIDGRDKGKFTLVCNYSKCKKHWKGEGRPAAPKGSYDDPKQVAKREVAMKEKAFVAAVAHEAKIRAARMIIEKADGKLGTLGFRILADSYMDGIYSVQDELAQRIFGSPMEKQLKKIGSSSQGEVERMLLCTILADAISGGAYDHLETLAKQHKVNVDALIDAVNKETHRCELCRCSELTACETGCSWDKKFLSAKRYVCTTAACLTSAKGAK